MRSPPHPPWMLLSCLTCTDQDAYQVCRQWTIAVFQHITLNDFDIRLVGGSVRLLGSASYSASNDDDNDTVNNRRRRRRRLRRLQENVPRNRSFYNSETNAGTDAVFSTVAIPTFYSALPSTVGLLDDNYDVIDEVCGTCCLLWSTRCVWKGRIEKPRVGAPDGRLSFQHWIISINRCGTPL